MMREEGDIECTLMLVLQRRRHESIHTPLAFKRREDDDDEDDDECEGEGEEVREEEEKRYDWNVESNEESEGDSLNQR